jgi:hypothetical protein
MKRWWLFAFVLFSCSGAADKWMFPFDTHPNNKIEGDPTEVFDPRVDILFVVDSSGSMMSHQENLAKNIDLFVDKFVQAGTLDFHVGVITTDMDFTGHKGQLWGKT